MSIKDFGYVLCGLRYTLSLVFLSVVFGFVIGIETARIRTYKNNFLKNLIVLYSSVFRGTPLLLQMIILSQLLPKLSKYFINFLARYINFFRDMEGVNFFPPFTISAIALIINSGAYFHEIFVTLFKSIPPIQKKLSTSLGFTDDQYVEYIARPQIIRNSSNQFIVEVTTLFKETALFGQFGIEEIYHRSTRLLCSSHDVKFLFLSGIIYYICSMFIEFILKYLAQKFFQRD
jgi:His/Glu/Gln/Arg/opine family amino acid ABC transporter permease subunit